MTGRKGLTWVTALTIASLLLGIGALNALAEGHGGGDHGGATGRPNAAHQQETPHAVVTPGNHEGEDDGDHHRSTGTPSPTPTGGVVRTAHGDDDDERATHTATPTATADVERERARHGNGEDGPDNDGGANHNPAARDVGVGMGDDTAED